MEEAVLRNFGDRSTVRSYWARECSIMIVMKFISGLIVKHKAMIGILLVVCVHSYNRANLDNHIHSSQLSTFTHNQYNGKHYKHNRGKFLNFWVCSWWRMYSRQTLHMQPMFKSVIKNTWCFYMKLIY